MVKVSVEIASGPFDPTWKSLGDHFKVPAWFRQAKIGMWLHWGPQSVGEDGDWWPESYLVCTLPPYGVYAININGLTVDNFSVKTIEPDARLAVKFDNVQNLEFNGVKAKGINVKKQ